MRWGFSNMRVAIFYHSDRILTKGFWQIPIDEASRAILAMSTPLGLVEPTHMPFGMKNAPSVFQREIAASAG